MIETSRARSKSARQLRAARDLLLSASEFDLEHAVRLVGPEIASSWQRSRLYGLDPGASPALPRSATHRSSPRLLAAAIPVLEELQPQLDRTVITLADRASRIAWRGCSNPSLIDRLSEITAWEEGRSLAEEFLGTNGVGTEVEVRGPLLISGSAHYMEACQEVTAASMSVIDPITRRLEAVVTLTRPRGGACDALLPLVVATARRIEARLLEGSSTRERALLQAFVRMSATRAEAVASLNEAMLITNPQAAELLDPADHATIWEWGRRCVGSGKAISGTVTLAGERPIKVRCLPVEDGSEVVGMVVAMGAGMRRSATLGTSTATSGVAGSWTALREHTHRAALENDRLLLLGEPGSGKATLAEEVCSRLPGSQPVRTIDCGLDAGGEADGFLPELRSVLARSAGAVILRHADLLRPETALVAATALRAFRQRVLLTCNRRETMASGLIPLLNLVDLEIEVPALRERADDIPTLAEAILREISTGPVAPQCSSEVLAVLMRYGWPGNVAELRQVLKSALAKRRGMDIRLDDLPRRCRSSGRLLRELSAMERVQRDAILEALQSSGWDHKAAAEELGISRATIYRKVKQMGISPPPRSRAPTGGPDPVSD